MANGTPPQYSGPPMWPAPAPASKKNNTVKLVVGIGVLAGAGYVGYRYWYLPRKLRQIAAAETQRRMQQGMSGDAAAREALAALCGPAGTAIGAAYGVPIPPDVGKTICSIINPMDILNIAQQAAMQGVNLATQIIGGVGAGVGAIGKGIGSAIGGIGSGIGTAATAIASVPLEVGKQTFNAVGSLATGAAKGVGGAANMVVGAGTSLVKGAGNVVADVGKALNPTSWF